MKEYILTVKFQIEYPENNIPFARLKRDIEEHNAEKTMTFGDIVTTEVKLEENESNSNETNSPIPNN